MRSRSPVIQLAEQLIQIPSITPQDLGCQDVIQQALKALGFECTDLSRGSTRNTWAQWGSAEPLLVFSGHTDVVPPGPENKWLSPPFLPSIRQGNLYGRGAADMKGALAAMVVAIAAFITKHAENIKGSIGFMLTSDEEGDALKGTIEIVKHLQQTGQKINWCIIGEASSQHQLGDAVKIGRRGSLHGFLRVLGKQGHIAYPQLADNPIHRCFKILDELTHVEWDQGNADFVPTSFQIYQINADTGASNLIPGSLTASFNFRYSPSSTAESLQKRVHAVLDNSNIAYEIDWKCLSKPFLSPKGMLLKATQEVIQEVCGIQTQPNTSGGTSDGRFIAETGAEILELGAINNSIHQVNEHIRIEDLERLVVLYEGIMAKLLLTQSNC